MTIVLLGTAHGPIELKFDSRPTQDQLCALLASGLFHSMDVIVNAVTDFHISGERLAEFGKMRWALLK